MGHCEYRKKQLVIWLVEALELRHKATQVIPIISTLLARRNQNGGYINLSKVKRQLKKVKHRAYKAAPTVSHGGGRAIGETSFLHPSEYLYKQRVNRHSLFPLILYIYKQHMIKTSLKPKTNTLKLKISEGNPLMRTRNHDMSISNRVVRRTLKIR